MSDRSLSVSGNPLMAGPGHRVRGVAVAYAVRAVSGDLAALAAALVFGDSRSPGCWSASTRSTHGWSVDEQESPDPLRARVDRSVLDEPGRTLGARPNHGWWKQGRLTPQGADREALVDLGPRGRGLRRQ